MSARETGVGLRLLAVSHNLNLEGASISMFELMTGLARLHGFEITLLALSGGPLRDCYKREGIPVMDLPFDQSLLRSESGIMSAIGDLSKLFRNLDGSVVYANTLLGYPAIHAAANSDMSSIWNIRESQDIAYWTEYLGERFAIALSAFSRATSIVFVAKETQKLWRDITTLKQDRVINNAIDFAKFREKASGVSREVWRAEFGIDKTDVVFLCVGTMHERKGQMDLLVAAEDVIKKNWNTAVVFLGDGGGEYSRKLHETARQLPLNIRKKIHFLPKSIFVADAYSAADVLVCCSRNESYPRVILEAMGAGLAIITTPVFGISEQVEFGRSAICYSPGDISALATEMAHFLIKENRERYGEGAARRINELATYQGMVNAYADIINDLVGRPALRLRL